MKVADVRELNAEQLAEELDKSREELMRLRFQMTTGELTDYNRLKTIRAKIARILTVLRERQLSAESEGEK